jgi:hypothetical protein
MLIARIKVAGSNPDYVNFFIFIESFRPHYVLEFSQLPTDMWTRSRKLMFLESREQPVHKAYNLTAIYEPIV